MYIAYSEYIVTILSIIAVCAPASAVSCWSMSPGRRALEDARTPVRGTLSAFCADICPMFVQDVAQPRVTL